MKKPRLVLSEAAIADILEQADWYRLHSGRHLALRWERSVTSSLRQIVSHPFSGSPCSFRSFELSGVRRVMIPGFPKHLAFTASEKERCLCCASSTARGIWKVCCRRPGATWFAEGVPLRDYGRVPRPSFAWAGSSLDGSSHSPRYPRMFDSGHHLYAHVFGVRNTPARSLRRAVH